MRAKMLALLGTTLLLTACAHTVEAVETHAIDATEQAEIPVAKLAADLDLTVRRDEETYGRYYLDDGKGHTVLLDRAYPNLYQLNFRSRGIEYPGLLWKDDVLLLPIGAYNSICLDLGRTDALISDGVKVHRPYKDQVSYDVPEVNVRKPKEVTVVQKGVDVNKVPSKALPLKGLTIVIDAGHGGKDPGGIGVEGIREKDIVLKVSLKVEELLKAKGATVLMTRRDDRFLELKERSASANDAKADLFLSIHANIASSESAQGVETWFTAGGQRGNTSQDFSKVINDAVVKAAGAVDRGARADQRGLHVLRATDMPAALLELGFMSNKDEATRLADNTYLTKLAQGIADGLVTYRKA